MTARTLEGRRLTDVFRSQVVTLRKKRGWGQKELAARLSELGFTGWSQSKVAKLEQGRLRRSVVLEDWLAIAAALGVTPVHLLFPGDEPIRLTPDDSGQELVRTPLELLQWSRGYAPLFREDHVYWTERPEAERIVLTRNVEWGLELMGRLAQATSDADELDAIIETQDDLELRRRMLERRARTEESRKKGGGSDAS